jgi:hypothetical protein
MELQNSAGGHQSSANSATKQGRGGFNSAFRGGRNGGGNGAMEGVVAALAVAPKADTTVHDHTTLTSCMVSCAKSVGRKDTLEIGATRGLIHLLQDLRKNPPPQLRCPME